MGKIWCCLAFFKAMPVHAETGSQFLEITFLLEGYEHWFAGAVACMTAVIQEAAGAACHLPFSNESLKQL